MSGPLNAEPTTALDQLIADGFQELPTMSVQKLIAKVLEATAGHGGRWPTHITAPRTQVLHWQNDVMEWSRETDRGLSARLQIMNARVIQRAGPITLIWSEVLK